MRRLIILAALLVAALLAHAWSAHQRAAEPELADSSALTGSKVTGLSWHAIKVVRSRYDPVVEEGPAAVCGWCEDVEVLKVEPQYIRTKRDPRNDHTVSYSNTRWQLTDCRAEFRSGDANLPICIEQIVETRSERIEAYRPVYRDWYTFRYTPTELRVAEAEGTKAEGVQWPPVILTENERLTETYVIYTVTLTDYDFDPPSTTSVDWVPFELWHELEIGDEAEYAELLDTVTYPSS